MNEKQKQEIWAKADRYVESIEEDTDVYLRGYLRSMLINSFVVGYGTCLNELQNERDTEEKDL